MEKLLKRDDFRDAVFERDGHRCVFCETPAVDAHHIMERRLWPDGGYYLSNGASVCEEHHLACEMTLIEVDAVREACGIKKPLIPPHLYHDQPYDKWGNPLLPNGQRLKGELFFDESVQKILQRAGVLGDFSDRVKYPRTHHLPWSEGVNDDDRVLQSLDGLRGSRVIVTEKMDGENTTLYSNGMHARSVDGMSHPSRAWVKALHARFAGDIPAGWRVCGENLYAQHSIAYEDLPSYFMGFSIWNERNVCLGWDETLEWFGLLGITPVPVLYDGMFDERVIRGLWSKAEWATREGYVVRVAQELRYAEFKTQVGKFVRHGHVQTAKHWMFGRQISPNGLVMRKSDHV